MTGNLSMGDNVKAIFGAGSDLQIYHSGTNSVIDNNKGHIYIRNNVDDDDGSNIYIQGKSGENSIVINDDSNVELYFDNAPKLATTNTGINVTGTVTADGLTMDTSANSSYAIGLGANRTSAGQALGIIKGSWNNTVVAQINLAAGDDTTNKDNGRIFLRTASAGSTANRLQVAENGDISFYDSAGSSQSFYWDSADESLGIGTTSPKRHLHINGGNESTKIQITNQTTGSGTDGDGFQLGIATDGTANLEQRENASMVFSTNNTPRMTLDASGNLLVGATDIGYKFHLLGDAAFERTGTTSQTMVVFRNGNGNVGSISTSGSATAYNTSSDYRLKTDAQPMTGATDRIKQLNPVNFEWIADGTRVDGFLAHEAQAVVPEAVTGAKDAMRDEEYEVTPAITDDDGNVVTEAVMGTRSVPDYQGIDQSKMVPLLVATIHELEARITALENA